MSETNITVPALSGEHGNCREVADILGRIGDKWTLLVVRVLSHGSRRYSELRRLVDGISQRMLTLTLKGLERDGLVTRTMFPTIPPRVDYELTELGLKLRVALQALRDFALAHHPEILAARSRFAARRSALPPSSIVHRRKKAKDLERGASRDVSSEPTRTR